VDAIKFRMEQLGLTAKDLEPVIGRKNRVYEIFCRRRPLTLRMIECLYLVGSRLRVCSNSERREALNRPKGTRSARTADLIETIT